MRIVLENSGYNLLNFGDIAMLQAAIHRLRRLFPGAEIGVLTSAPELLAHFCPGTSPIVTSGRERMFCDGAILGGHYRRVPGAEAFLHRTAPRVAAELIRAKHRARRASFEDMEVYEDWIVSAGLVLGTGGGYLTDAFPEMVRGITDTIRFAARQRKPIALLGQGIGPLENSERAALVRAALEHVQFIALREGKSSPATLAALGYPADRTVITGDDAIELAYVRTPKTFGKGIGVNLRTASYAQVEPHILTQLRDVFAALADTLQAPLVPVPISCNDDGEDARSIQAILETTVPGSDGGRRLDTVEAIIDQAGSCRLVITGSYHAGVFALSQGIPVIGLSRSAYYVGKFEGLAAQFGAGCAMVSVSEPDWSSRLAATAHDLYARAETLAPQLRKAAEAQIALGHDAYGRLRELAGG